MKCHHNEWTGMKIEVPMFQRIRVTLQRRINLIHRLDRTSFVAPSLEGTMVQSREITTAIVNSRENDDAYYMLQSIPPLLKH